MENLFVELAAALWQVLAAILSALSPLLIGLILAYLLDPLVTWLRPKLGSGWAIAVTYISLSLTLFALLGGFVVLILGNLPSGGWQETVQTISAYFRQAYQSAENFFARVLPIDFFPESSMGQTAAHLLNWLRQRFSLYTLAETLTSLSGGLLSFFLGLIVSIYLLKDKAFFLLLRDRFLSRILGQKSHGLVCETIGEIDAVLSTFLKGAFIDSLIVAFLSSVFLSIVELPFAVVIGLLAGVLNIIPYFGPVLGMACAALVALLNGNLPQAALAVLSLLLVQQIDCNFIYPRVVGQATGLHPLFILLSVSVLGGFFGIAGMVFAVPLSGIAQIFIRRWAYHA